MSGNRVEYRLDELPRWFSRFVLVVVHAIEVPCSWTCAVNIALEDAGDST